MIYKVPRTAAQLRHVEGAPIGTRGGMSVVHIFPADGEYTFRDDVAQHPDRAAVRQHHARRADRDFGQRRARGAARHQPAHERVGSEGHQPRDRRRSSSRPGRSASSAAFIARSESPVDDLLAPVDYTLADTQIGSALGVTTLPHLARARDHRPAQGHGRVRHRQPPPRVHLPADDAGRRSAVRGEDSCGSSRTRPIRRPVSGDEVQGPAELLSDRRARTATSKRASAPRCRRFSPARSSSSGSSARQPASSRGRTTASPTSISRRGCRTSCGARFRIRSWSPSR